MALDFPAAADALWAIHDATGIRPEWLLPVLWHESSFNPSVQNGGGAPYYGVGQNGTADIQSYGGTNPTTYMGWPASKQLSTVVLGYFRQRVQQYGSLHSGVRVYQAEFLPGTLPSATALGSVIASKTNDPNGFYKQNPSLDFNHDGAITLSDLASVVAAAAATSQVQAAITAAYTGRIDKPSDPVYGYDFGRLSPWKTFLACVAIASAAGITVLYINEGARPFRRVLAAVT